jgi:hypothetical protein
LRLFCQRKAAKSFCYQDFSNAFSFETIGTKEKALQKENAVFCANAARATAFEKAVQNNTFGSCEQSARQIKIYLADFQLSPKFTSFP